MTLLEKILLTIILLSLFNLVIGIASDEGSDAAKRYISFSFIGLLGGIVGFGLAWIWS